MIEIEEANNLIDRISEAVRGLISDRSMLDSMLFPVQIYMPLGLYNFFDKICEDLRRLSEFVSPEELGKRGKRMLSEVNQKAQFAIITGYLTGREQVLIDGELPSYYGEGEDEVRTRFMLDFWKRSTSAYRNDGGLLVREENGSIQVLPSEAVTDLDGQLKPASGGDMAEIRELGSLLRSYLYLLNSESRGGVFSHGPYPVEGGFLVSMEFRHLWKGFEKAEGIIPLPNMGIVVRLRDVKVAFDEVGTMVAQPTDYYRKAVAFGLFTRRSESDVAPVALGELWRMKSGLERARRMLFDELRGWDRERRIVAGALQYSDYSSYLNAFGMTVRSKNELSRRCLEEYLPRLMRQGYHPIYQRFVSGGRLFSHMGGG